MRSSEAPAPFLRTPPGLSSKVLRNAHMAMLGKPECRVLFELFSTPRGKVSIGRVNSGEHAGRIVLLREVQASMLSVIAGAIEVTRGFTHPQLLKLVGVFSDGERSYVASEYLPGVSLFELLARVRARQTALELGAAVHVAAEALRLIERAGALLREAGKPRVRLFYADCLWIADYGETLLSEAGVSAHLAGGRSGTDVDQGAQAVERDAMTIAVELVQLATARLMTGDLARGIREHLPMPLADALEDVLVSGGADVADPVTRLSQALRALPPNLRGSEAMLGSELGRIARDLLEERRLKLFELQISAGPDSADVTRIYGAGAALDEEADEVTAMVQRQFRGRPVTPQPVALPPPASSPAPASLPSKRQTLSSRAKAESVGSAAPIISRRANRFGSTLVLACAAAALIALAWRHPEWYRTLAQRLPSLFR